MPELARRFGMGEAEQRRVIDEQDVVYNRLRAQLLSDGQVLGHR